MNTRIRYFILVILFSSVTIILLNCGPKLVVPKAENVFSQPNTDYEVFKKVAFFVDFTELPKTAHDDILLFITEDELRKLRYKVVSHSEFASFYNRNQFRKEDLYQAEKLSRIRDEFQVEAIFKGTMEEYNTVKREETPIFMDKTTRSPVYYVPAGNVTSTVKDVVDMKLHLEMIDSQNGQKIWSCSLVCNQLKIQRNWYLLFRRMIQDCLRTIPLRGSEK